MIVSCFFFGFLVAIQNFTPIFSIQHEHEDVHTQVDNDILVIASLRLIHYLLRLIREIMLLFSI